jgi:hypothetical protein
LLWCILSILFFCHIKDKGTGWIWCAWGGEGHIWESKEPCISNYINWVLWDWFPKDQVNLSSTFMQRTPYPLVELLLPLTKPQMSCRQPFPFWRNKGHSIEGPHFHGFECSDLGCI